MIERSFKADFPTENITEGAVKLLVPKLKAFVTSPSEYAPSKAPVFYNPVMELNRDVAVLALQAYQRRVNHEITVCEPLASGGFRGTRFAAEVEGVRKVIMNDINERAVHVAKHNVSVNRLDRKAVVKNKDANLLLSSYAAPRKRFDAIDIDPFGSPVPYIDSAVRAIRDNGLLALTATDMAPLCGVHPKACIRKYGGKPLRTEYCHELAIRLLAGCLATMAAKHEIGTEIVFTHNVEHYIRVYATMRYGAKKTDEALKNMGYILHCFKCFHRENWAGLSAIEHQDKCSECNSKLSVAGPLWIGKLVDADFCKLMDEENSERRFKNKEKIKKTLDLAKSEVDAPVSYYVVDRLCDTMNLPVPSVKKVAEALREEGYYAVLTQFNPKGIKTNASAETIKRALQKALFQG